jgi:hypothetical protein
MTQAGRHVRYAVYYAPPPASALAAFADAWLGEGPAPPGIAAAFGDAERAELTAPPRRYGFHGTLKAPFRLADEVGPADLASAVARLAETAAPVRTGALALTALGPFLALCPGGDTAGLGALADRIVRDLDALRARLTAAETARRRPERLSPRQREHLARWGYPYVLEDFGFHLTLTGPLAPSVRDRVAARLAPLIAPFCRGRFEVADLCIFGDPGPGRSFELLSRHPLGG